MLPPAFDLLSEEMTRKTVHFSHVTAPPVRLGVKVVRGEMIASCNEDSVKVAFLPRHPVQRFDRAYDCDIWNELVVCVYEQLRPRAINGQGFHRFPIRGQSAVLDDAA